jgi:hypothetical protein
MGDELVDGLASGRGLDAGSGISVVCGFAKVVAVSQRMNFS